VLDTPQQGLNLCQSIVQYEGSMLHNIVYLGREHIFGGGCRREAQKGPHEGDPRAGPNHWFESGKRGNKALGSLGWRVRTYSGNIC